MPDLLPIIVERWKTGFKGISALEIKDLLGMSHEDAMTQLRALEVDGAIRLRECRLGEPSEFKEMSMGGVSIRVTTDWAMTDTLMAFPSPRVLEDAFHTDRIDYGEFTNRLYKGASQVEHYFFRRDVLDRYLKQPERYVVEQDRISGSVSMTTAYYLSIPDDRREKEGFATIRFGNMKLADGTESIAAIAKDLDELPEADQHHWAAHEVKKPAADENDKAWTEYVAEQFYGSWRADHTDHIKFLIEALEEINGKKGMLFRTTIHPRLHVPGLNTYGEYIAAHKELYKLLGADNLDEATLEALLRAEGCGDDDFIHKESGRRQGKWALFKMLAGRRGLDWAPFKNMAERRVDDSHKIREKTPNGEYYPARFREDAVMLALELRKLL